MHGARLVEGHQVGDINKGANGAFTDGCQSVLNPFRALAVFDTADHTIEEYRAVFGFNVDRCWRGAGAAGKLVALWFECP